MSFRFGFVILSLAIMISLEDSSLWNIAPTVSAFCPPAVKSTLTRTKNKIHVLQSESIGNSDDNIAFQAEQILQQKYPSFYSLLSKNEKIWQSLAELTNDFTLFVPNEQAFQNLGQKRITQLKDERNLETAQKIGLYHVVDSDSISPAMLWTEDWTKPKPADGSPRLLTVEAILTMSGKVPVGRSKSGGIFGLFEKEGNDVVIGPAAKIVRSFQVVGRRGSSRVPGNCIIHEMDALISPEILWRYCDQLQIPIQIPGLAPKE